MIPGIVIGAASVAMLWLASELTRRRRARRRQINLAQSLQALGDTRNPELVQTPTAAQASDSLQVTIKTHTRTEEVCIAAAVLMAALRSSGDLEQVAIAEEMASDLRLPLPLN